MTKKRRLEVDPVESDGEFADSGFASARAVIEQLTGEKLPRAKNPAAVALGKLGASAGGNARAKKLSAKRRSEIAKRAAKRRWSK